jgi:hypothetical protein
MFSSSVPMFRSYVENYLRNQLAVNLDSINIEKYIVLKGSSSTQKQTNSIIETERTVNIDSNTITNRLPKEWISTVTADIQSQSSGELKPRHGFSDAYSFGMPPKRRKIVKSSVENSSKYLFKNVLLKTFKKMNINKDIGELIIDSLSKNKNLSNLFSSKLDKVFINRLNKDDDYKKMICPSKDSKKKSLNCSSIINIEEEEEEEKDNDEKKKKLEFTRKRNKE